MLGDVWRRVRLDLLRFVDDLLTTRSTGEDCAPRSQMNMVHDFKTENVGREVYLHKIQGLETPI